MPNLDFTGVPEAGGGGFSPLPDDEYICEIIDVTESQTQGGTTKWNIKYSVIDGDYLNRHFYDSLFFSQKALPRVKLLCSRLGFNVGSKLSIDPKDFIGKRVKVKTIIESYEDMNDVDDSGNPKTKTTNRVEFAGFAKLTPEDEARLADNGDIPF